MEKEIKEALNFAIGAAKSLREQADSILLKVEKEFKELASKGAQDQSEVAKNLRKYIEDALHSVEGVAGQVNSKVEEVKSKVNQGVSSTKVPLNGSKEEQKPPVNINCFPSCVFTYRKDFISTKSKIIFKKRISRILAL